MKPSYEIASDRDFMLKTHGGTCCLRGDVSQLCLIVVSEEQKLSSYFFLNVVSPKVEPNQ